MKLIKTTLVGIGQIFLQDNGWSGLLITIAMGFAHPFLGITCFLGALIGTLTATALKYKQEDIDFGLYGFNASLAYMCTIFTFALHEGAGFEPLVWIIGAVAAVISTIIMNLFVRNGKVAFTFPFVVTCWFLCWGIAQLGLFGLTQTTPNLPDYTGTFDAVKTPFFGWAEVNFGASFITGVLIFLALAISNPSVAMWGTAAGSLGALIAHSVFGIDINVVTNGIFSFSPILVACAFVTFAGNNIKRADFIYIIVGIFLAVAIQYGVVEISKKVLNGTVLTTYTFGFIAASWIMLAVKGAVEKANPNTEDLVKSLNP